MRGGGDQVVRQTRYCQSPSRLLGRLGQAGQIHLPHVAAAYTNNITVVTCNIICIMMTMMIRYGQ